MTALIAGGVNAVARVSRVLLVEDDPALADLFAQILVERGHHVDIAYDVPSALQLLANAPAFDVVVTDLRLPGASGLELLAFLQQQPSSARVVVASAFTTSDLAQHARRLGAHEVLSKPFEPAALVSAVEGA